jgi:uncharacterized protein YuzE
MPFPTAGSDEAEMKIEYFPDTDTLYISLSEEVSADAEEVAPGVVVDFDAEGRAVGIEIDPASTVTDPAKLETNMAVEPLKLKPTA